MVRIRLYQIVKLHWNSGHFEGQKVFSTHNDAMEEREMVIRAHIRDSEHVIIDIEEFEVEFTVDTLRDIIVRALAEAENR